LALVWIKRFPTNDVYDKIQAPIDKKNIVSSLAMFHRIIIIIYLLLKIMRDPFSRFIK